MHHINTDLYLKQVGKKTACTQRAKGLQQQLKKPVNETKGIREGKEEERGGL